MTVNLDFSILDNTWNTFLPNFKKIITNASKQVFEELDQFQEKDYEISILLSNNKYIKDLNLDYRSKNKATNVLSFPMIDIKSFDHENILGDIVISIDKILSVARHKYPLTLIEFEVFLFFPKISSRVTPTSESLEKRPGFGFLPVIGFVITLLFEQDVITKKKEITKIFLIIEINLY